MLYLQIYKQIRTYLQTIADTNTKIWTLQR